MAVVALAPMDVNCLNDWIFSLLDRSWYAQSILKLSTVPSLPIEECSTSQSFMNGHNNIGGQRQWSMSESEMRVVFDKFDSNGDGLISEEELRRYMSCCRKKISDAEIHSMIASVDHNCDGSVDFQEFLSLYQNHYLDGDATRESADKGASEDDSNKALLEAFRVFDKNQDGFISPQELQAVLQDLGMAEGTCLVSCRKMIRNVDRDGDGHCDIVEFQKMMSQPRL